MMPAIAFVTELSWRLVVQRTVRSHRVVFAPKPLSFLPCVRHVLELLHLQELVPEPTVERLAVAVLPRTPRRYRQGFGPLPRQPLSQRLTNKLRTVVAADAPWCSTP